jgi:predicted nucleotidyltransferase
MPMDVVLAGPGLEELFLSRAVPVTIGNLVVPVISPEDLIATKILAGRPKDIEDVRGILRERLSTLDLESIRSTLALLEEALGQSDLRPILERELARGHDQPR